MKPALALIGPGRVGSAISRLLLAAGYPLKAVIGRNQLRAAEACRFIGCAESLAATELRAAAEADIVLLAVPDDAIAATAAALHAQVRLDQATTLVHFSGRLPAEQMRAADSAARLLSLHPLLPFADRQLACERLANCPCALEGDSAALPLGAELAAALKARHFFIPGAKKPLYHAAACIASNFLVTLLGTSRDLLIACGLAAEQALPLLLPLVQATLDNAAQLGPEQGLTGPIVRGDSGTVAAHLTALEEVPASHRNLYRQLATATLALAQQADRLTPEAAATIQEVLQQKCAK